MNANLKNARLLGADLRKINLEGAELDGAIFGNNMGVSEKMKQDLIKRGAVFKDKF